jgi:transposase-like protein
MVINKSEKNRMTSGQNSVPVDVARPRVITVDKNPTYPVAIQQLKNEKKDARRHLNKAKKISEQHRGTGSPIH